jgi:hypothetical protein
MGCWQMTLLWKCRRWQDHPRSGVVESSWRQDRSRDTGRVRGCQVFRWAGLAQRYKVRNGISIRKDTVAIQEWMCSAVAFIQLQSSSRWKHRRQAGCRLYRSLENSRGHCGRDPTHRYGQCSAGRRRWRQDPLVDAVEENQICLSGWELSTPEGVPSRLEPRQLHQGGEQERPDTPIRSVFCLREKGR